MTPRIHSVNKAFQILDCFTMQEPLLSLREVSVRTGFNVQTTYRYLQTLKDLNLLMSRPGDKYCLGHKIQQISNRVDHNFVLAETAHHDMKILAKKVLETVHLGILVNHSVMYIGKVESNHSLRVGTYLGMLLPAYCSGLGKILLAGLSQKDLDHYCATVKLQSFTDKTITDEKLLRQRLQEILNNNYAIDNEEIEYSLSCIAMPIYNDVGKIIAAISVSGPKTRMNEEYIQFCKKELNISSQAITQKLNGVLPQKLQTNKDVTPSLISGITKHDSAK